MTSVRAGRRRVPLTHPEKVLFPADGVTKADLAAYYAAVAPAMVPHVRDRPLNLWRWNAGIDKKVVVQQEIPKGAPDWVRRVTVPRRRGRSSRANVMQRHIRSCVTSSPPAEPTSIAATAKSSWRWASSSASL